MGWMEFGRFVLGIEISRQIYVFQVVSNLGIKHQLQSWANCMFFSENIKVSLNR